MGSLLSAANFIFKASTKINMVQLTKVLSGMVIIILSFLVSAAKFEELIGKFKENDTKTEEEKMSKEELSKLLKETLTNFLETAEKFYNILNDNKDVITDIFKFIAGLFGKPYTR